MVRRTNYKNEKRTKELDKQKKKDAKKERKLNKDKTSPDEYEIGQEQELEQAPAAVPEVNV